MPEVRSPALPADVIPIQYHFNMLGDAARMDGFSAAIALAVRPGMKVLELGGGTGVLSWFAARAGAEVVWCVEKLPEMAAAARGALGANPGGERVVVVEADARAYLPPEPVDVVICEMLHTGLLREKQLEVIASFKQRYRQRFGGPLPRFVPDATLQAVQPVQQDFGYHGYTAATPCFQDARCTQPRTLELGPPQVFQSFQYAGALPERCAYDGPLAITADGTCNAIRVITKNLLAIQPDGPGPDWIMGYLVMPLARPLEVRAGERPHLAFSYRPGDELPALGTTLRLSTDRVIDLEGDLDLRPAEV